MSRVVIASFLVIGMVGCGGGASVNTPTAPTTPAVATPAPQPAPQPQANLVAAVGIDFLSCVNGLCTFRGVARNDGNACAVNISGESWILSAQGVEVARARWSMLPSTLMRPGDELFFFGEGMSQVVLNHLDGRARSSFSFESRQC